MVKTIQRSFRGVLADGVGELRDLDLGFTVAAGMLAIGVFVLAAEMWIEGYPAMAAIVNAGASFTLARTLRDAHEANRLIGKIEDAATERVLREAVPGRP